MREITLNRVDIFIEQSDMRNVCEDFGSVDEPMQFKIDYAAKRVLIRTMMTDSEVKNAADCYGKLKVKEFVAMSPRECSPLGSFMTYHNSSP